MKKIFSLTLAAALPIAVMGQDSGLTGDVNNDGVVNSLDVEAESQYIVQLNPSPFDESKADVNADGVINVDDAVDIARIIVSSQSGEDAATASYTDKYAVTVAPMACMPGSTTYLDIYLWNANEVATAFQMDLVLPTGVSFNGTPVLSARGLSTHRLYYNYIDHNHGMFLSVSDLMKTFLDSSGIIVTIPIKVSETLSKGEYDIELYDIRVVKPYDTGYDLPVARAPIYVGGTLTGVEDVKAIDSTPTEVYNLQGIRVANDYKGIVVERCSTTGVAHVAVRK